MFRYLLFILLLLINVTGCNSSTGKGTEAVEITDGKPKLVFDKEMYNFGDVKEGDVIGKYIHFKNDGTSPLVLNKVIANCGCIEVKYPDKPVKPGETGKIEVIFDTNGFYGRQVKFLKIFSNDSSSTEKELMIFATVEGQ